MTAVLVHYSEVALKGKNRSWFVGRLVRHIHGALAGLHIKEVRTPIGRIEIVLGQDHVMPEVLDRLSRIFGIHNYSVSTRVPLDFEGMIPNSLYTVMVLRRHDIRPVAPTRPGPLGIPNVFIADAQGRAKYSARMPHPFPTGEDANRIIDVIVLWISPQMSFGGAIGLHGLGGDVHAQLKTGPAPFIGLETLG